MMKVWNLTLRLFCLTLLVRGECAQAGATQESRPISLVFNLDQGMPNGIIENLDLNGLARALNTIRKFEPKYKVYVLFSPLTVRSNNLALVLKMTAKHKVHFLLDAYTSDAMALGNIRIVARADAAPAAARAISLDSLRRIKRTPVIGAYFAGIRFHEVSALDFTVKQCLDRSTGPGRVTWCDHFRKNLKNRDILNLREIVPYFEFARNNDMTILWSDWKWDGGTAEQQEKLAKLIRSGRYKHSLALQYANNLPDEASRNSDIDWRRWLARYSATPGKTTLAIGLSDQSWLCRNQQECPPHLLARWADNAIKAKSTILSFEPSFYFFHLPREENPLGYPNSVHWRSTSGAASPALIALAHTLGVNLDRSDHATHTKGRSAIGKTRKSTHR